MPTKSPTLDFADLSRRERQILTVLYRLKKASAGEVRAALPDPPTYTAIRTHLTLLESKGHVKHATDGSRYIYSPVVPREEMGRRVIESLLENFFDGSVEQAVTAFVKRDHTQLSDDQLQRLEKLIQQARKEGR
jgi:BlaI family transcriptional regulator, penicillinase repressor